ncbi:hypothetical protein NZR37_002339 [Salmonella enterica]|nr:hypothetical protein [Salmonella enterica]
MFNIRNTQLSVNMQAIAGTAAPEAAPEELVWEKIHFFFPAGKLRRSATVSC